ncbi:DUF1801 domain-containing protein [Inquilinus sp. KBS0705]|nr:DUF1801 domain-containing protein [Inquilinus sp. KBS0705]
MNKPKDVDEYISRFPAETQQVMQLVRATIKNAAPGAEEVISYSMPAYKLNGMLVYFAAYDKHIGFYPTSLGIAAFKHEFASYKSAKGSVQFPLGDPMPLELITRIVQHRVKENKSKIK